MAMTRTTVTNSMKTEMYNLARNSGRTQIQIAEAMNDKYGCKLHACDVSKHIARYCAEYGVPSPYFAKGGAISKTIMIPPNHEVEKPNEPEVNQATEEAAQSKTMLAKKYIRATYTGCDGIEYVIDTEGIVVISNFGGTTAEFTRETFTKVLSELNALKLEIERLTAN